MKITSEPCIARVLRFFDAGKSVMPLRLMSNHCEFSTAHKIKMLMIFLVVRLYVFCEYDKIYTNIISERGEKMEHIKGVEAYGQK